MIFGLYDSESEFSRKIGWSRQRLSRITNGKKEPTVGELQILAENLNASVSDIAIFFT